jgi:hypothetical protein
VTQATALGAGREVAHRDLQPGFPGEFREPGLPGPVLPAVAPAGVAGDQQPRSLRAGVLAGELPPAPDRFHRERGVVVAGAHVHEPGVRAHVVNPVRDRVPAVPVREVMAAGLHRIAFRPPFPPVLRVLANLLFLLGIHADHQLPGGQVLFGPRGDVAELGVPVRVPRPLLHPGSGLRGEPPPVQHPPGGLRAARVPLPRQRFRQVLHAFRRPRQRRLRVPPGGVLHQRQQRRQQAGIGLGELLAARTRPPDTALRRHLPGLQLRRPVRNRLPGRPGQLRHRRDPALARRPCHRPQRQPPGLLIQHRQQQLQLRPHQPQKPRIHAHTRILARDTPETHVIPECSPNSRTCTRSGPWPSVLPGFSLPWSCHAALRRCPAATGQARPWRRRPEWPDRLSRRRPTPGDRPGGSGRTAPCPMAASPR